MATQKNTINPLKVKASDVWRRAGLLDAPVTVNARPLSIEEVIGNPESHDFSLQEGKGRLMQATFDHGVG